MSGSILLGIKCGSSCVCGVGVCDVFDSYLFGWNELSRFSNFETRLCNLETKVISI